MPGTSAESKPIAPGETVKVEFVPMAGGILPVFLHVRAINLFRATGESVFWDKKPFWSILAGPLLR